MAFNEQFYTNAIKEYENKVNSDVAQQAQQATANAQSQLQQAYIQRMQNKQQLNNNLQQQGIRGGVSETANLNMNNAYMSNRNAINSDMSNQVTQLQTNANDNIFNYRQQMKTAQAEYLQNKQAEDERKLNDYYNSVYAKSYSTKDLKKALAKATSQIQKTAINNRIAYLKAHKKKY